MSASTSFGTTSKHRYVQPLQSFNAGGRARKVNTIAQALPLAKDSGSDSDKLAEMLNWADQSASTEQKMVKVS